MILVLMMVVLINHIGMLSCNQYNLTHRQLDDFIIGHNSYNNPIISTIYSIGSKIADGAQVPNWIIAAMVQTIRSCWKIYWTFIAFLYWMNIGWDTYSLGQQYCVLLWLILDSALQSDTENVLESLVNLYENKNDDDMVIEKNHTRWNFDFKKVKY